MRTSCGLFVDNSMNAVHNFLSWRNKMMNTHSLGLEQTGRGEQLHLLKSFDRFLKLRKYGFPFSDARHMTGLQDDLLFEKAQEIYKNYL